MKFKFVTSKDNILAKTEDTLYSAFTEHMGRCIYGGIYDPTDINADNDGFRKDVLERLKTLNLSIVRYPGGNFVSGYNWEDGIGPKESRPVKREEAWKSIETNEVGTDEYMKWTKKMGVDTMMAVNLGTGTTESAKNLAAYCNSDGDDEYANLRRKNGHEKAYGIKYWGLGNEMDGDWQIGHLPADKYVIKAKEAALKMRSVDPSIKLIACGSSMIDMPTFPEWDRTVVDGLYDEIDFLSIHHYYFENTTEDDFYASYVGMEKYINILRGIIEEVQEKHGHKKDIYLCFDEYNIWYNTGEIPQDYQVAPRLLEEYQSLKDTIVFGGLTNTLLNNCDIVKISCIAQLVNVIAPMMVEKGDYLLNGIWYPFYNFCNYTRGNVLKYERVCDNTFSSKYGESSYISLALVDKGNEVVIQVVNYAKEDVDFELEINGINDLSLLSHEIISGDNMNIRNSFENKYNICPKNKEGAVDVNGKTVNIKLDKLSYNFIRLSTLEK